MSPLSSTNLALKKSCMICEASRSVYIIAHFRIPVSWPGFPQELPSVLLFPRLPSPPAPFEIPSYLSTTVFGIDTIQTFQGHQYIPPTLSPVLRVGARTYLQCWQCLWPPKLSHRASMTRCAVLQLSVLGRGLGRAVWRLLHPASKPRIEEMTLEPFVSISAKLLFERFGLIDSSTLPDSDILVRRENLFWICKFRKDFAWWKFTEQNRGEG